MTQTQAAPDLPAAHRLFAEAVRHHQAGRLSEAVTAYRGAIGISPAFPEAHNNLGGALQAQGKWDEAAGCHRAAIVHRPAYPEAHTNLGLALRHLGRLDEAMACHRMAIQLRPDFAEAHDNLGEALREAGRLHEAAASHRTAIALRPDLAAAHDNLGLVSRHLGLAEEAAAHHRQAIALDPDFAAAHANLGAALRWLGRLDEALACYHRAIALRPGFVEAIDNAGLALRQQGRLDEAADCHRRALTIRPDMPAAHFHLGIALLTRGDLAEGWREYEWRWHLPQIAATRRAFPCPQWSGEPADGRTLLIHAEQGFGDTLQFCRYAPLAAARGFDVVLAVQKPLVRLLSGLAGAGRVIDQNEAPPPGIDVHCPMLSLPLALGTVSRSIPGGGAYLHADPIQAETWRRRLAAPGPRDPRVGLVWAGNPRPDMPAVAEVDRRRSISPERLAPLAGVPGVRFFSLQKDGPAAPFALTDVMAEMEDFADTAALIANLDLVISVDTAAAHLAAALGKPVWLLNRFDTCWRWLTGRADSPWYSTLRIYRQPRPDDWDSVVAAAARDLRRLVSRGGGA